MKLAPLTLLVVCAAPARADVAVPQPKTWRDGCVVRINEAATKLGMPATARITVYPLLREDGAPNPVQYVEYGHGALALTVGEETETRPDAPWTTAGVRAASFRRYHGRFARTLNTDNRVLRAALDDCLKMGEAK